MTLDPQYAEAYAWLGGPTGWSGSGAGVRPPDLERALALAQQAIALDDSLPIAHSLLSKIYAQKQQYDQAIAEGERAIALDPNNADSYARQAEVLNFAGRPEEALRVVEQAMRLNPRYPPFYLYELGLAYRLTGQYAEAIAALKEVSAGTPILCLPTCSWLPATCGSGSLNRAPMPRRWSRRWRRCNGLWPSMTPAT